MNSQKSTDESSVNWDFVGILIGTVDALIRHKAVVRVVDYAKEEYTGVLVWGKADNDFSPVEVEYLPRKVYRFPVEDISDITLTYVAGGLKAVIVVD